MTTQQTSEQSRDFDVIPGRKYVKVAEWLGSREDGQRTVRWFKDRTTGIWYAAESWKRPNLHHPLTVEQSKYVEGLLLDLLLTT